jgi:hypothetical protein
MARWLGPSVALLLTLGVTACGGVVGESRPRTRAGEAGYVVGDRDDDDRRPGEPRDGDDFETREYGRAATAGQRSAVAAALRRYYAVAATGDGAAACGLLDARLAAGSDLERFLPQELRPAAGSSVFRGKGCAAVESLLLVLNRPQLRTESATLRVSEVRVRGVEALAVMRFRSIAERQVPLRLEKGRWRVDALLDSPLL